MCLANPALETGLESQLWLGETPAAETEGVSSEGGPSPGGRGTWQLCSPRWRGGNDVLEAAAQCQTWHHRHGVDLEALQICNLAAVGFAVSDKWAWWSQLS